MHDRMQYDSIQGQRQGHEPLEVGNPSIFKRYLLHHLLQELATDHWSLNWGTVSKFDRAGYLIIVLVLCLVTLNLTETSVAKSRQSIPHGDNLFTLLLHVN